MAPTRVAAAMGRHRLVLERLGHGHDLEDLLTQTWDALDDQTRERFFRHMFQRVLSVVNATDRVTRRNRGAPESLPFNFDSDDLDIDRSVEQLLSGGTFHEDRLLPARYEDFLTASRSPESTAYMILIDVSRSMRGSKAMVATTASVSLSLRLDPNDELGVIAFSEDAQTLRSLKPGRIDYQTMCSILELRPKGCTDIHTAIRASLEQFDHSISHRRVGILITDGWQNTGRNPVDLAQGFTALHVLELPGGDHSLCAEMAQLGSGRVVRVDGIENVPTAISECLSH